MNIETRNLGDDRAALIAAELRAANLPYAQVVVISESSEPSEIPGKFAEFCDWQRREQRYRIIVKDDIAQVIGGGEIGALYGVYELIKAATGVRWYGIADADIGYESPRDDVACADEPDVVLRGFEGSLAKWDITFVRKLIPWMGRNRLNMILFNAAQWMETPHRAEITSLAKLYGVRLVLGGHAPQLFLPEELFDTHPDWFGLRDGVRCLTAKVTFPDLGHRVAVSPIQPCYSNPQARAHIATAIANFIDNTPQLDVFSLWPHDGINNWCECERCAATTPFEMLYAIALEVIERGRRDVPIEVLCYTNTLDVPKVKLKPCDRVYVLFCPYLRQYKHRFYDDGFDAAKLTMGNGYPKPEPVNPADDREYGVLLNRWLPHLEASGAGLGVFAYYQLVFHDETGRSDRSRYLYHPEPTLVGDEVARFKQCGMQVFYDCSWPIPGFWPDARFYAYLPELLWGTSRSADELIDRYYGENTAEREALQAVVDAIGTPQLDASLNVAAKVLCEPRHDLWLAYVRMAAASRAATGEPRVRIERQIIAWFDEHREALEPFVDVRWMQRYSQAVIASAQRGDVRGALPTG